jgi:hypothetical protein
VRLRAEGRRSDPSSGWTKNESFFKEGEEMAMRKKPVSKREMIEPHQGDKRYVRRTSRGTFGKTVDLGRSLSADSNRSAKTKVSKGQGDRGDRVS